MMSAATDYELEVQRRNTTAYIESDPTDLVLNAKTRTDDGEGGATWENGDAIAAQRCRIIVADPNSGVERRTVDGETLTPEIILLMEWDALVEQGWTFTWQDGHYEIVWVTSDLIGPYEKMVEVVRRG